MSTKCGVNRCMVCNKPLSKEEIEYFETSCEHCERDFFQAYDLDRLPLKRKLWFWVRRIVFSVV